MSRADELVQLRQADGTWRWEPRGEPSVEIVTEGRRHRLVFYLGGRPLWSAYPRSYRWMWRARRAAVRWVAEQRRSPDVSVVK